MSLLNLNRDNVIGLKMTNGMDIVGKNVTPEGVTDKWIMEDAIEIELQFRAAPTAEDPNHQSATPIFHPLTRLADMEGRNSYTLDATFQAVSVLCEYKVNPDIIAIYQRQASPIML